MPQTGFHYVALFILACASMHAGPRELFKEIIAGEGNVANIEVEEVLISYSYPEAEAEIKALLNGVNPLADKTPKFYRMAKQGEFYSMEYRTGIPGELISANGRDGNETWTYTRDKYAEALNASKGTSLAKGRVERVALNEPSPGEAGLRVKSTADSGWAHRSLSASIKMGIPLAPGSGSWSGDTFSGLGLRPDLRYAGHVNFSTDGRPVSAEYTFSGPDFHQKIDVRYLEHRTTDGLPNKFSIKCATTAGSGETSETSYTIHSVEYGEAPSARFSSAAYGEVKDLVVIQHSDGKSSITNKGRVQADPKEVKFWKKRAWAGVAILVVLTPAIIFYASPRARRKVRNS